MINFDCNNYSLLSEKVSLVMQKTLKVCQKHRSHSFGVDQRVKATIEKARYQIAGLINARTEMFFFDGSFQMSDINLIQSLVSLMDIREIIMMEHENDEKVTFLKELDNQKKIKVSFVETDSNGKLNLDQLAEIIESNTSSKLVTLSHANRITGNLLPVKGVASICARKNVFFHLSTNLTIGRYQIDFQKLSPDFMSFGCNLINGPEGIGAIVLNNSFKIERPAFNLLYKYFQNLDNKNLPLIAGMEKSVSLAVENVESFLKSTYELTTYLSEKLKEIPGIVLPEQKNKGLINLVSVIHNKSIFGDYLKEKMELKGFVIDCPRPCQIGESHENESILPIALSESVTQNDIDLFIECLIEISDSKYQGFSQPRTQNK